MTDLIGTIAPSMKIVLAGVLFGGLALSTLWFNSAKTAPAALNSVDGAALLPTEPASDGDLATATFALG